MGSCNQRPVKEVTAVMKLLLLPWAAMRLAATPALAQDEEEDLRVRVGAGAQLRPEFKGADDTEFAPLFDVDIAKGSKPFRFEAPDDSFGLRLISNENFAAGPAAKI